MILELRHEQDGNCYINLNENTVQCIHAMEFDKYVIYLKNGDYITIYNEFDDALDEAREMSFYIFDPDPVHNYITRNGSYYTLVK